MAGLRIAEVQRVQGVALWKYKNWDGARWSSQYSTQSIS